LVQLGIRQARYVGRTRTLFQLLLAATVANLTLLAKSGAADAPDASAVAAAGIVLALATAILVLTRAAHAAPLLAAPFVSVAPSRLPLPQEAGFRPDF
jgi:hypothetical protein